ncbi:MAG: hypothetical protein AB7H77_02035, partial [Bdellovibrionales bacterium]
TVVGSKIGGMIDPNAATISEVTQALSTLARAVMVRTGLDLGRGISSVMDSFGFQAMREANRAGLTGGIGPVVNYIGEPPVVVSITSPPVTEEVPFSLPELAEAASPDVTEHGIAGSGGTPFGTQTEPAPAIEPSPETVTAQAGVPSNPEAVPAAANMETQPASQAEAVAQDSAMGADGPAYMGQIFEAIQNLMGDPQFIVELNRVNETSFTADELQAAIDTVQTAHAELTQNAQTASDPVATDSVAVAATLSEQPSDEAGITASVVQESGELIQPEMVAIPDGIAESPAALESDFGRLAEQIAVPQDLPALALKMGSPDFVGIEALNQNVASFTAAVPDFLTSSLGWPGAALAATNLRTKGTDLSRQLTAAGPYQTAMSIEELLGTGDTRPGIATEFLTEFSDAARQMVMDERLPLMPGAGALRDLNAIQDTLRSAQFANFDHG